MHAHEQGILELQRFPNAVWRLAFFEIQCENPLPATQQQRRG